MMRMPCRIIAARLQETRRQAVLMGGVRNTMAMIAGFLVTFSVRGLAIKFDGPCQSSVNRSGASAGRANRKDSARN
jgi:hypothetical protein